MRNISHGKYFLSTLLACPTLDHSLARPASPSLLVASTDRPLCLYTCRKARVLRVPGPLPHIAPPARRKSPPSPIRTVDLLIPLRSSFSKTLLRRNPKQLPLLCLAPGARATSTPGPMASSTPGPTTSSSSVIFIHRF
ncbi:hypothetical protein KSP39_PZI003590 [Platanthera zijinensis]|uniref:Uncharacterized protein n=1 Tax=Platanthera zijinensis TaxID=2320716 RepID=A0AAP0GCJ0_9ASPA